MKKILLFAVAVTMIAAGCTPNDGDEGAINGIRMTVDFEGEYWDALVDNPQNDGELLYGGDGYAWEDSASGLYSELTNSYGDNKYWGGGVAVSNYVSKDFSVAGTSNSQLSVYTDAMHSGRNCVVCTGYEGDYGDSRSFIGFKNGTAVIESLWICPTTYSINAALNGCGMAQPLSGNDYVNIIAIGYNTANEETGRIGHTIHTASEQLQGWTRWSLASLGEVAKIRFDFKSRDGLDVSFQPAYIAIDDITVIKKQ